MSREVKRVALDFQWPLGKTWEGYINHLHDISSQCQHCKNGYSPEAQHLLDLWYGNVPFHPSQRGSTPLKPTDDAVWAFASRNVDNSPEYYGRGDHAIMKEATRLSSMWNGQWCHHLNADDVAALIEAGRLHDLTHTWEEGKGWQRNEPPYTPTPEEINRRSLRGIGHDSINQWVCVKAECERHGWPTQCSHCGGSGQVWPSKEAEKSYEDWQQTEPPAGDGWQMWETTSEGSPISPVFRSPEELAAWLVENKASLFGSSTATYDQWMAMIKGPGWAPSMVTIPAALGLVLRQRDGKG